MNADEKDKLCVAAKKQAGEYIKEYYASFGWALTEQKEDERYEDTELLYFERPHYILDKDDLQLLQVKLEIALNKMGKLEQKKSVRAGIFGPRQVASVRHYDGHNYSGGRRCGVLSLPCSS